MDRVESMLHQDLFNHASVLMRSLSNESLAARFSAYVPAVMSWTILPVHYEGVTIESSTMPRY